MATKVAELLEDGRLTSDPEKVAVFCSDLTDTNRELILDQNSLLKGVMASGDLVGTLQDYAAKAVAGEELPEFVMEPLSYVMSNEDGSDIVSVYYDDLEQLPDTEDFFN